MKKILKYSSKILILIILLPVVIMLIFSLFSPIYDFDEPQVFSGPNLHNPYDGMDSTAWLQCNFHAHTRQAGGFTNGRNNTNERLDSVYQLFGYDHIGISNYNNITYYKSDKNDFIPAYEHGYGLFKIHQLCIGAERVRYIDYPFWQTLSMKQHNINRLKEDSRLVVPAHPSFVRGGYKIQDFKYLSNYKLLEVLNGYCKSPAYWDEALSNGHLVYLLASDDAHNMDNINDPANCFTMINSQENDAEHLFAALESGKAVGVCFPIDPFKTETIAHKVQRLHDNLPYISKVDLKTDTLVVRASKTIAKAEFIGQGGQVLSTVTNVNEVQYIIQSENQYVRTVLYFADGTELWLNPITRYDDKFLLERVRLDHLSYGKTALSWTAYLVLMAGIVVILCRKKKTGN